LDIDAAITAKKATAKTAGSFLPNFNFVKIKRWFYSILIGGVVASALIAVFTIMLGEWTELSTKALFLVMSFCIHSLIIVSLLGVEAKRKGSKFAIPAITLLVAVALFLSITIIFEFWGADNTIATRIYGWLFASVIMIAVAAVSLDATESYDLQAEKVASACGAIALMINVILTFISMVLLDGAQSNTYSYASRSTMPVIDRLIICGFIIAAVSFVLQMIFRKKYLAEHPELKAAMDSAKQGDGQGKKSMSAAAKVVLALVLIFVVAPIVLPILFFLLLGLVSLF
jgi:hypothetical protein